MLERVRQYSLLNLLLEAKKTPSIILILLILVTSCTTGSQLISEGNIRVGMSKQELRNVLLATYPAEDPFLSQGKSEFFYNEKKEIIYGEAQTVFYVFRNVSTSRKCGTWTCSNGNGYLDKWFYSYYNAKNYITEKKIPKVKATKKIVVKKDDTLKKLNKIVADYKSGKITEEEFNKKKKAILD